MNEFLEASWYGNTPREWLMAGLIAAFVLTVLRAVEWLLTRRFAAYAERSRFDFDDAILAAARATRFWFLLLVALWAGSLAVAIPETTHERFETLIQLALVLQASLWGTAAIRAWVRAYGKRRTDSDPAAVTTMRAVGLVGQLMLWALLLVVALGVLGIQIAPLIAGLGIGGIAIALAVQNILGDLFASLSIVLDKPFVIGDFIIVGDLMGTVEQIGLKTTRVRSLSGEQLVFSNSDLLNSRIRNFKRMYERRVVFGVGVTYQTPRERLAEIPGRIREIVESLEDTRFDRAHFKQFGASSIDFETVYYVKSPDYNVYMDRQQSINLGIHEYFEGMGIEFAYPTQTIWMASETDAAAGDDAAADGRKATPVADRTNA